MTFLLVDGWQADSTLIPRVRQDLACLLVGDAVVADENFLLLELAVAIRLLAELVEEVRWHIILL